ncbi:NusG domain II-containing protein [Acidaminococcus massiliensis]|uniref:NusG domain II-containing protein n=1 Tax=Acidaminococcus massiliensis TaxID=1852375 RepID=UPI0022E15DAC|nr:NusG domain II-containing protein [Acidaminococcus massiliensis]
MRKNDFWLILVLLVLAAGSWFLFRSDSTARDKVLVVRKDQQVLQRIELKKVTSEAKLIVPVEHGEMVIAYDREGGRVLSSPCPDQVCVHQGKITRSGQTIACVPEKVLVTITTAAKENDHDAILR